MNPPRPPALAQPFSPRRVLLGGLTALLLAFGSWQLGGAAWMTGKAWLSQILIAQAWGEVIGGAPAPAPWPWADTHPVARLDVPEMGISRFVMADSGGTSLAFGPGHVPGSAKPGNPGHSVIAGHRDSHFAFLQDLETGQVLRLQGGDGSWRRYSVTGQRIVDLDSGEFLYDAGADALTLVTCWPFGAIDPRTPYRYLVTARRIGD